MKVKDIIQAAKNNLNIADNDKDDSLLFYLKNVINEVASEFIPVYTSEKINVTGGRADIGNLTKTPIKITSVGNDEQNLEFEEFPFGLRLKKPLDGEVRVTYSYLPVFADEEDDLPYREYLLRALCFGLCAEYCLVSGIETEAQMWDMRYKDAIREAAFPRGEHLLRQRGWY